MDINNPVIKLCIEGTQAEFRGCIDEARAIYLRAWELVQTDYEACIVAHYIARYQEDNQKRLEWNLIALDKALAVGDERVKEYYPSLYVNLGRSYELLGCLADAKHYYDKAADFGLVHDSRLNGVGSENHKR